MKIQVRKRKGEFTVGRWQEAEVRESGGRKRGR
jgi:hypothetical protein